MVSTNNLDKSKIYRISFKRELGLNPFTWLGAAIRTIAKIPYNHTGVLFFENGVWMIQEAIGKGVKKQVWLESNAYNFYTHFVVQEIKEPKLTVNEMLHRISFSEGLKYDYAGLLFFQLLLNVVKKWFGKKYQDKKFYCYEHVAYVFGFDNSFKVSPKEFNKHFEVVEEGVL